MKPTILITTLAAALLLTACGQPTKPPADVPAASAAPVQPADWREETAVSARSVLTLEGVPTEVCVCVEDGGILLYRDAPEQELLARADYPVTLEDAAGAFQSCDLTDLDGDGNSDLAAEFAFPDGTDAGFLWFRTAEGYVFNPEFSRLPGETGPRGEGD